MPEELELDIDFYRRRLLSEKLSEAEKSVVDLVIRVSGPYVLCLCWVYTDQYYRTENEAQFLSLYRLSVIDQMDLWSLCIG